ncbi:hypothetical protein M1328_01945 [Patescibacteria group bacterium]|nr:hypothetical protein [Patescibacteria group bacterium]
MRKQIIIASVILVIILLLIFLISRPKSSSNNSQFFPTPTTVVTTNNSSKSQQAINNAMSLTPYENADFRVDYSASQNQLLVLKKTPQAVDKFNQWALSNGLSNFVNNSDLVVFQSQNGSGQTQPTPTPYADQISALLNVFLNLGKGGQTQSANNPPANPTISNSQSRTSQNKPPSTNFTYYAQCDSPYENLALPGGCNMCQAGCGAATVAMIASSFVGMNYTPQAVIDLYKSQKLELDCNGSNYYDARTILSGIGVKTTDYMIYTLQTADQIIPDLKKYQAGGWTFFTLADFKDGGAGGHYFWITNVDDQGNIWAYDPYYGRFQAPPINENSYYPFPKYYIIFGVKK